MIRVEINGNDIYQSQKNCGVCGEANSTEMVVAFSEDWLAYSKKVVFYDARGSNPVTVALLESNRIRGEEQEVYSFKIPGEPLVYEGKIEFVVDGSIEGVCKKSVGGELRVRYSPDSTSENVPAEVAQTVAEQLQAEAVRIGDMAMNAVPYIGENGNWFKYDSELKEYVDTGVCAKGPQGEKGEQGEQGIQGERGEKGERGIQGERGEKGDAGQDGKNGIDGRDGADGHTPIREIDYWTEEDKREISKDIRNPIMTETYIPAKCIPDGSNHVDIGVNGKFSITSTAWRLFFPVDVKLSEVAGNTITVSVTIHDCGGVEVIESQELYAVVNVDSYEHVWSAVSGLPMPQFITDGQTITYTINVPEEVVESHRDGYIAPAIIVAGDIAEDGFKGLVLSVSVTIGAEAEGEWLIWDIAEQKYVPSGVSGKGYTPQRGVDYWTEADKAEIKADLEPLIVNVTINDGTVTADKNGMEIATAFTEGRNIIAVSGHDVYSLTEIYTSGLPSYGEAWFINTHGTRQRELWCMEDTWGYNDYESEATNRKVTALTDKSTDTQYPSAKAVVDYVNTTFLGGAW